MHVQRLHASSVHPFLPCMEGPDPLWVYSALLHPVAPHWSVVVPQCEQLLCSLYRQQRQVTRMVIPRSGAVFNFYKHRVLSKQFPKYVHVICWLAMYVAICCKQQVRYYGSSLYSYATLSTYILPYYLLSILSPSPPPHCYLDAVVSPLSALSGTQHTGRQPLLLDCRTTMTVAPLRTSDIYVCERAWALGAWRTNWCCVCWCSHDARNERKYRHWPEHVH